MKVLTVEQDVLEWLETAIYDYTDDIVQYRDKYLEWENEEDRIEFMRLYQAAHAAIENAKDEDE